ncbi:hypothetical protein E3N88_29168 [Mikania micrantha]|uniref:Uncharacterized protein n=1 Tax=Mikania micrantha TaxID=192012 RepID=A0A5N6MI24_9ASTR|nr:hypothetical protein E3N88_29168 [Mikania micrantha]
MTHTQSKGPPRVLAFEDLEQKFHTHLRSHLSQISSTWPKTYHHSREDAPFTTKLAMDLPEFATRTIAKGPETTTWIWNLHVDAHDFDSHTSDLEEISRKVFSAHFGQLSIIFLWLSGMYFHGARFSDYEAWLSDPTHIGPSAQIWRSSGITSELQLYCTAIGALIFAALMLFAGWFHYHKAAPKLAWFQDRGNNSGQPRQNQAVTENARVGPSSSGDPEVEEMLKQQMQMLQQLIEKDQHTQEFRKGYQVLVYDSRLRLFPGKLKSKWKEPFVVHEVFPHGTIELESEGRTWKVNGHRLKLYIGGPIDNEKEAALLEFRK